MYGIHGETTGNRFNSKHVFLPLECFLFLQPLRVGERGQYLPHVREYRVPAQPRPPDNTHTVHIDDVTLGHGSPISSGFLRMFTSLATLTTTCWVNLPALILFEIISIVFSIVQGCMHWLKKMISSSILSFSQGDIILNHCSQFSNKGQAWIMQKAASIDPCDRFDVDPRHCSLLFCPPD